MNGKFDDELELIRLPHDDPNGTIVGVEVCGPIDDWDEDVAATVYAWIKQDTKVIHGNTAKLTPPAKEWMFVVPIDEKDLDDTRPVTAVARAVGHKADGTKTSFTWHSPPDPAELKLT